MLPAHRTLAACLAFAMAVGPAVAGAAGKSRPAPPPEPEAPAESEAPPAPAPPPAAVAAPAPAPTSAVASAAPAPPARLTAPLAGFANDRVFLRSPSNTFMLFPQLRVDVDAALFPRQTPKSGAFVRRAHLELAAWLGPSFYVVASGDFASEPPPATPDPVLPSAIATSDDYV